jgi:hypothetical protein
MFFIPPGFSILKTVKINFMKTPGAVFPFILLLLLVSSNNYAQYQYKKGVLINSKNEEQPGLILDRGDYLNSKVCIFKTDRRSPPISYSAKEISGYRFESGNQFRAGRFSVKGLTKPLFAEVLVQGKISLLHSWGNKEMSYFIRKENGKLVGLMNKENQNKLLVSSAGEQARFPRFISLYRDSLSSIFSDDSLIRNELEKVGYNRKDLIEITRQYLYETCKVENCVSYEKDLEPYHIRFGILSGFRLTKIAWYETKEGSHPIESTNLTSIPAGIFLNAPLNFFLSNLSLQAEIMSARIESNTGDVMVDNSNFIFESTYIGVPVSLRYRFLQNKLSPTIFFGKETSFVLKSSVETLNEESSWLHRTQKGGWLFGLGMDYKINNKLALFSDLRFQSYQNLVVDVRTGDNWLFNSYKSKNNFTLLTSYSAALFVGFRF